MPCSFPSTQGELVRGFVTRTHPFEIGAEEEASSTIIERLRLCADLDQRIYGRQREDRTGGRSVL